MSRVEAGLSALLVVTCPKCDGSNDIEFDNDDIRGATQIIFNCDDCGQGLSAYLDALVQTEAVIA